MDISIGTQQHQLRKSHDIVKMYYSICSTRPSGSKLEVQFRNIKIKYALGQQIGKGAFSKVYRAKRRTDGAWVAVKYICASCLDKKSLGFLLNEAEIQK